MPSTFFDHLLGFIPMMWPVCCDPKHVFRVCVKIDHLMFNPHNMEHVLVKKSHFYLLEARGRVKAFLSNYFNWATLRVAIMLIKLFSEPNIVVRILFETEHFSVYNLVDVSFFSRNWTIILYFTHNMGKIANFCLFSPVEFQ